MTVKEAMLYLRKKDITLDFCDDYDERAYIAYCDNNWSKEAEKKYEHGFNLTVDQDTLNSDVVIVHCETEKDAEALRKLLLSMAGYLETEEEYDILYPDDADSSSVFDENLLFQIMQKHVGHNVSIVKYGTANTTLECEDCGCVLFDTDIYDLIGVV